MSDNQAETLRRAASLMRERARGGESWELDSNNCCVGRVGDNSEGYWILERPGAKSSDLQHIASWHPAVALAVADWLWKSAETWERLEDDLRGLMGAPTIEQVYGYDFSEALAVAHAYLGDQS
jgi:hypothetical protein